MKNIADYGMIGFYKGRAKENNIISFLYNHTKTFPQKIALQWAAEKDIKFWDGKSKLVHQSIVYKELMEKIVSLTWGLSKLGIAKGDRVIIFIPLSLELYLAMFAVQMIGAIAVFLDSWARREQLGICAQVVEPKAIISLKRAFDFCEALDEIARIPIKIVTGEDNQNYSASLKELMENKNQYEIEPVNPHDPALITFTTGSSGIPKGADRTHRFLSSQHYALDKVIPYDEEDKDLPVFPIFSLNNLAGGVTTVLPAIDLAKPTEKDASVIVNQIISANITCCTVSPSIFVKISKYCLKEKITLSSLRRIVTGGAPISKDDIKNFKEISPLSKILALYGSTEVEPIAHIEAEEMLRDDSTRNGVNVGEISQDLEYKFIKIYRAPIQLGEKGWQEWEVNKGDVGELVVSGKYVCENYYNNEEAAKSTKIKESSGKIWHRTGDVGVLDELGRLWLVGRVHNTIIRNNKYFFPVYAEILLKGLDFVRQAAFLGLREKQLGEKTCAVISLKEEANRNNFNIYINEIKNLFAQQKIPLDEVKIIEEIPMDPRHHSKVEYGKLREMV